ncbi:hypothetical protein LIER_40229 [Lithospermum erythrorhizon]|uniref:Uncharacterized protein n=1 Tax=Lithospermum erythrorhizon TaxID=34254 RepID=A0AAV3QSL1_LITER
MLSDDMIESYKNKLHFDCCFANSTNKVWLFWNNLYSIDIIENGDQHVHFKLSHFLLHTCTYMTVVYAASKAPMRRVLWKDLTALFLLYKPWVLLGDFNAITSRAEHKGAAFFYPGSSADFNAFIST